MNKTAQGRSYSIGIGRWIIRGRESCLNGQITPSLAKCKRLNISPTFKCTSKRMGFFAVNCTDKILMSKKEHSQKCINCLR